MADGNWGEWRNHVLREIGRLNSHLEKLEDEHIDVCVELGKLRVMAAAWGAIAGIVVSIGTAYIIGG